MWTYQCSAIHSILVTRLPHLLFYFCLWFGGDWSLPGAQCQNMGNCDKLLWHLYTQFNPQVFHPTCMYKTEQKRKNYAIKAFYFSLYCTAVNVAWHQIAACSGSWIDGFAPRRKPSFSSRRSYISSSKFLKCMMALIICGIPTLVKNPVLLWGWQRATHTHAHTHTLQR